MVIFGDSLSDVGNISAATLGLYPGDGYPSPRFSNGPVYAELLAAGLGLPTVVRSGEDGNNFAYGGAQTTGTGGFEGIFIRDVDEQLSDFNSSRSVDPGDLHVVFAGANDLFAGQTNMAVPVQVIRDTIEELYDRGAREFLVPNLPLLGYTPRYNGSPSTFSTYNTRSTAFNNTLDTMLHELESGLNEAILYRYDTAALFVDAITNPAAYGFSNVTDQAAPGLEPGPGSYDGEPVSNPEEYLFWDNVHPTASGHAMFAGELVEYLSLPGDFNGDSLVDAADYTIWRNSLGATVERGTGADGDGDGLVDQGDYRIWKAHFGQARSVSTAANIVPEPANLWTIASILAVLATTQASRGNQAHRRQAR